MKAWKTAILILVIALLSWGLVSLEKSKRELETEKQTSEQKLQNIEDENRKLKDNIEYLQNPDNRVKVLKEQTNLVAPGEHLVIPVTNFSNTSSSATSTSTGN